MCSQIFKFIVAMQIVSGNIQPRAYRCTTWAQTLSSPSTLFLIKYYLRWDKYELYRKKIITLTGLSTANYYRRFFDLNTNNMRQTWREINQLLGSFKKRNKRKFVDSFLPIQNEVSTSHPKENRRRSEC